MSTAAPTKPVSKAGLKKAAIHEGVTLPSGAVVTVRIPNLPEMIAADKIPNELVDAAIKSQPRPGEEPKPIEKKDIIESWDFVQFIVPKTLHEPQITSDEVSDLDTMDVEMLTNFACRRTDMDAVGHQLGGLETQKAFRDHRGIFSLDEALEGSPDS